MVPGLWNFLRWRGFLFRCFLQFLAFGARAMTTIETLAPHLPYLRRYARALMGAQKAGDTQVRRTLAALSSGQRKLPEGVSPKRGRYRAFQSMWPGDAGSAQDG